MKALKSFFLKPYLYVVIVLVGVSLKVYKLDQQFFWDDEIATVLHTSGIPMSAYEQNIPTNKIISRTYFDDLLRLNDRDLSLADQFIGLSKMPQVTPGHYYYFIFLTRIFGDNYMVYRYFSFFIFLLSIPFLYLLSKKIFSSSLAGWAAVSLYAVSPFFQVYAQEARYYILWSFAVILMHYLFLMATDKQKTKWWILYIIFGFFAVHTTILFYITLLAHFIYMLIYYRSNWKPLFISQLTILLSSLPWLIFIYINREDIQQSLSWQQAFGGKSFFELILIHINQFIEVFIYAFKLGLSGTLKMAAKWTYGILLGIGLFVFFMKANNKQKWFVALITFLGVGFLISLDLIRSSISSNLSRYLLLNFIGIIILVSFVLKEAIEKKTILFGSLFLAIIIIGILSSYHVANDVAYSKRADAYFHVQDAEEKFSGNEKILIVTDFNLMGGGSYSTFMSLIHASKNPNIDFIYAKPDYPNFKNDFNFSDYDKVYGMYLSETLLQELKKDFTSDKVILSEKRKIYRMFDISVYNIQIE